MTYQERIEQKIYNSEKPIKNSTEKVNKQKTRKEKLFDELNEKLDDEKLTLFAMYFNIDEKWIFKKDKISHVLNNFPDKEIREAIKEIEGMQSEGIDAKAFLTENPKKFCPKCRKQIAPSEKFCIYCGEKIPKEHVFCPNCDYKPYPSDKFCYYCGTKLKRESLI